MHERLVLLPGMMCDARLFKPQIDVLSAHVVIDVPNLTQHDSVTRLAASVLADVPDDFALAGLSMGGIVAMEIMRQAPQRVTRLALFDTNPLAEAGDVKARRQPQIDKVQAGGLRQVMKHEMKPNYLSAGPNRIGIMNICMQMAIDLGPAAFVNQSIALRDRPDQQATLRQVTVPTLVACGEDDVLCPVERHELMCDLIAGSTLEIIEKAGHLPTLEQADIVNKALLRWLEA
jgi:pimeloyl-ACP methyl ester carboxylesterase